jgi:cellulose synthase/poly-beta-1,6-N-acetylglucosamine synthase-like glycosyltransferase
MWTLLALILGLICLPGTIELGLLTLASFLRSRRDRQPQQGSFRLAIVVPAHNEEAAIASTVQDLMAKAADRAAIYVVADNCQDATAGLAKAAGANILIRDCPQDRGKAAALRFAFDKLTVQGFDGFLVLDADSVISSHAVAEVRDALASGADAVQCRNVVANSAASQRTALLALALAGFNGIRPKGRHQLGLSAGPLANGFAVPVRTLRRVPFTTSSIVEDLEYHLLLVQAGLRVRFLNSAVIRSDMPAQGPDTASQRARWEGGRLGIVRTWLPRLLSRPHLRTVEPVLELLTLPLAYQAVLIALWMLIAPSGWLRLAAYVSALILASHIAVATLYLERPLDGLRALLFAPFYALWKISLLPRTLRAAKPGADWAEKSTS